MNLIKTSISALATYRLTKFFLEDHLAEGPRNKIYDRFPPDKTKIGFLFSCPHCLSFWAGTGVALASQTKLGSHVVEGLAYSLLTGLIYDGALQVILEKL